MRGIACGWTDEELFGSLKPGVLVVYRGLQPHGETAFPSGGVRSSGVWSEGGTRGKASLSHVTGRRLLSLLGTLLAARVPRCGLMRR